MLIDKETLDRWAEAWAINWPQAHMRCKTCGTTWPLVANGRASAWCPRCDSGDDIEMPREIMGPSRSELLAQKQKPLEEKKESEPEPEDIRCDPPGLDDLIGNASSIRWIRTVLAAFRCDLDKLDGRTKEAKSLPFPHTLWAGPSGVGKTTIAQIIAREIDRPIHFEMGQTLTSPARAGDILLSMKAGEILFIDEIHQLKPAVQEAMYLAMEDRKFIPIQKAGAPVVQPIRLPPFTVMGATTDEWGLLPPMLQRFKVRVRLERLTAEELAAALLDRAQRKAWSLEADAAAMIGERSHGTPRLSIALLDGCMATAKATGKERIDSSIVEMTCELLGIDHLGLDVVSRKYLNYLYEGNGNPVRLNVLATRLDGLSKLTVERRIEPDMVFLGLVEKTANGRLLTEAGKRYVEEQLVQKTIHNATR